MKEFSIEPYEPIVTFLSYLWWRRWDSNPRPPRCERGALPAEPRPHSRIYYSILQ